MGFRGGKEYAFFKLKKFLYPNFFGPIQNNSMALILRMTFLIRPQFVPWLSILCCHCNLILCAVVRTLTGHRSNCISVDFHPFGEFFASGSLDTNLKIWDIRKKGCIHTYKGHTRGVNAIRFTPDGRWVVSGGEDNTVKVRT